jgi:radical SAM protein with 4Fe4S-binding SPASM domain
MIKKMAPAQKNTPKFPCFFPWDSMVVLWDGRIVPCCNDYNGGYILGDVGKKSLEEIWNDQPMIELRKQQLLNRFENNNLCSGCYEPCGYRPNRLYPVSSDAWFVKRFLVRLMSMG